VLIFCFRAPVEGDTSVGSAKKSIVSRAAVAATSSMVRFFVPVGLVRAVVGAMVRDIFGSFAAYFVMVPLWSMRFVVFFVVFPLALLFSFVFLVYCWLSGRYFPSEKEKKEVEEEGLELSKEAFPVTLQEFSFMTRTFSLVMLIFGMASLQEVRDFLWVTLQVLVPAADWIPDVFMREGGSQQASHSSELERYKIWFRIWWRGTVPAAEMIAALSPGCDCSSDDYCAEHELISRPCINKIRRYALKQMINSLLNHSWITVKRFAVLGAIAVCFYYAVTKLVRREKSKKTVVKVSKIEKQGQVAPFVFCDCKSDDCPLCCSHSSPSFELEASKKRPSLLNYDKEMRHGEERRARQRILSQVEVDNINDLVEQNSHRRAPANWADYDLVYGASDDVYEDMVRSKPGSYWEDEGVTLTRKKMEKVKQSLVERAMEVKLRRKQQKALAIPSPVKVVTPAPQVVPESVEVATTEVATPTPADQLVAAEKARVKAEKAVAHTMLQVDSLRRRLESAKEELAKKEERRANKRGKAQLVVTGIRRSNPGKLEHLQKEGAKMGSPMLSIDNFVAIHPVRLRSGSVMTQVTGFWSQEGFVVPALHTKDIDEIIVDDKVWKGSDLKIREYAHGPITDFLTILPYADRVQKTKSLKFGAAEFGAYSGTIIGYSPDGQKCSSGHVIINAETSQHAISTTPGMSGAPIFLASSKGDGSSPIVCGIHVGSSEKATHMSAFIPSNVIVAALANF
jgi:hypothetical protein